MDWKFCAALAAIVFLSACSREEAPPPSAPASAPAAAAATAVPVATLPASAPATPVDPDLLSAQVWRVVASPTVAAGSLYVFLPDHTLLVATPGSDVAQGRWRLDGGRLVMVEEARPYPVDVLALDARQLRLRMHNPGTPVKMTLEPVATVAEPVPERFRAEWNGRREDCRTGRNVARLRIGGDTLRFHESRGQVLAAVLDPADADRLTVVARLTGEGSTRLAWRRFRMAPNGSTLTDITDEAQPGLVRVRCR